MLALVRHSREALTRRVASYGSAVCLFTTRIQIRRAVQSARIDGWYPQNSL
jgi:hypothetical protein